MSESQRIDGWFGRVLAFIVILVCATALIFINRTKLFGTDAPTDEIFNPELTACLENRVGAIDKMRADGVIDEGQYSVFRGRAELFCETEFGRQ